MIRRNTRRRLHPEMHKDILASNILETFRRKLRENGIKEFIESLNLPDLLMLKRWIDALIEQKIEQDRERAKREGAMYLNLFERENNSYLQSKLKLYDRPLKERLGIEQNEPESKI